MANAFDQFDNAAPPSSGNAFDQFDEPTAQPDKGGFWRNLNAGAAQGVETILGAPVDIANWAMHHNPAGMAANAISRGLGYGDIDKSEVEREASQPEAPIGGSEWLKQKLAKHFGELWNPENTTANTAGERITRAAGSALPMGFTPAGDASLVRNFLTMGAAGAGTQGAEEALPEETPEGVKQAIGVLSGIATGAGANAALRTPTALANGVKTAVRPFTAAGREQMAANTIRSRATNPSALENALEGESEIVTGSKPTTFQQTGDMGLGSLERESAARNPAQFMQRRAEQNAARVKAVEGIESGADPVETANFFRSQVDDLDQLHQTNLNDLVTKAHTKVQEMGGVQNPEEYGAALREALQTAENSARANERSLWRAVDPDNNLVMNVTPIRKAAGDILDSMSGSAKPMTGEEASIFQKLGEYGDQMPFGDIADLRSRTSAAMREELTTNGATPAYARLARLRGAIQDNLSNAVADQTAKEAEAVARGVLSPEQTIEARLVAEQSKWYANRAVQGRVSTQEGAGNVAGSRSAPTTGAFRTEREAESGPSGAPGDQGVPPPVSSQPFDKAAAQRLAEATNATKERAQTFGAEPVKTALAKAGTQDVYRLPEAKVPGKFFHPGVGAFADVQKLRNAVGDERALTILSDYAASDLRRFAERPDGTLDPKKVAAWQAKHADALRAFPELNADFSDAARASEAIEAASAARAQAMKDIQTSAIGRIVKATEPDDVQAAISSVFGKQNSVATMKQLAAKASRNSDAKAGLRQAVVNHITKNFIGNTEAGTSGLALMKSDQFQTFLKKNGGALATVLSPEEMKTLSNIAADLQRANRSIAAVKLPGGSNTTQDMFALYANSGRASVLDRAIAEEAGAVAGTVATHAINGTILGWLGAKVAVAARNAGIRTVNDLIDQAMLHPDLARELLRRNPMRPDGKTAQSIASILRKLTPAAGLAATSQPKQAQANQ